MRTDHCAICNYDLRGARGGRRCPECGQLLTASALMAAREKLLLRRLGLWGFIGLMVTIGLGPAVVLAFAENAIFVAPALVLLIAPVMPALVAAWVSRRIPD